MQRDDNDNDVDSNDDEKSAEEKKTIATECAYGTKLADMLPNANAKYSAYKSIHTCASVFQNVFNQIYPYYLFIKWISLAGSQAVSHRVICCWWTRECSRTKEKRDGLVYVCMCVCVSMVARFQGMCSHCSVNDASSEHWRRSERVLLSGQNQTKNQISFFVICLSMLSTLHTWNTSKWQNVDDEKKQNTDKWLEWKYMNFILWYV